MLPTNAGSKGAENSLCNKGEALRDSHVHEQTNMSSVPASYEQGRYCTGKLGVLIRLTT